MYYPDQRAVNPLTVIKRQVRLPDEAVGVVRIGEGKRVDVRDVIANGVIPTGYVIIDAADFFNLKNPDDLIELMFVKRNDLVEEKTPLAGKNPKRGKRLFSPIKGVIANVIDGRIIMQHVPKLIDLEAGVRGRISSVQQGRGVEIEAVGSQIQGVWGNNKTLISTLRMEPEGGLDKATGDVLESRYMGAVVVTRTPLTADGFQIMNNLNFSGVIAPSMDSSLIDRAMNTDQAIMLTEGFGVARMNQATYNLLVEFEGQGVTLDAHTPGRWEAHYPELIINRRPKENERPGRPNPMLTLRQNMSVRISRDPYVGQTGRILEIPKSPVLLENGLRVPAAQVELVTGETITVPFEDIEVLGR